MSVSGAVSNSEYLEELMSGRNFLFFSSPGDRVVMAGTEESCWPQLLEEMVSALCCAKLCFFRCIIKVIYGHR